MRKIKRKILSAMLIIGMSFSLFGCGNTENSDEATEENEYAYLSNLENGCFYILHKDKTYDKLEMPNATFSDISSAPSNDRIIWYKDNFEKIPTLYIEAGDKLVYFSTEVLDEQFTIERFEDLGYSIGMTGLRYTNSGRYKIENSSSSYYPNGDTMELTNLENEALIIDSVGEKPLRAIKSKKTGEYEQSSMISRCGTLLGFKKDMECKADVYAGTKLYKHNFKADVKVMGSMAVTETINFNFINEYIAEIEIPEYYNNGYYMPDAKGIFRLVTTGTTYDKEKTNFNVPNTLDEKTGNTETSITKVEGTSTSEIDDTDENEDSEEDASTEQDEVSYSYGDSYKEEAIDISEAGTYQILVNIEYPKGATEGQDPVKMFLLSPDRTLQWDLEGDNMSQSVMFSAEQPGRYIVCMENMQDRTANCNLYPQD